MASLTGPNVGFFERNGNPWETTSLMNMSQFLLARGGQTVDD